MIRDWLSGLFDSDDRCKHYDIATWPDEDESIWYLKNEERGREYWSENDAAYVKLREVEKDFVCLGCGVERTIETAERVGGPEGIVEKSKMSDEAKANVDTDTGAYFNGWPDDHFMGDSDE